MPGGSSGGRGESREERGMHMEESGFVVQEMGPGVTMYVWPTRQFKTVSTRVVLHHPLGEDATETALVPQVLLRGSARYPTTQALARRREELFGTELGADVSKLGRDHLVWVGVGGISPRFVGAGSRLLRDQLELLAEVLFHPREVGNGRFDEEYTRQEKNVLRQKIERLINEKRRYGMFRLYQEMCQGDPFAIHRLGRLDRIESITAEGLFQHYREILAESPVSIFVVGPVDPQEVQTAIQNLFPWSKEGRQSLFAAGPYTPKPNGKPRTVREEQEVNQALLYLGYRTGITFADERYPALSLYSGILGAFPHSKLFIQVREKASLAYFAFSQLEPTMGLMVTSCGIDPANYERALDLMRAQVEAMARGEFSDEEMAAARASLRTGLRSIYDSPDALVDRTLLGVVNRRLRPPEEMIAALDRVTKDDIVEVAQQVELDTIYFLTRREGGQA